MKAISVIGLILLVIAIIIAGPLLLIWSLNTLFPLLAIPYNIWTWLATLILSGAIKSKVTVNG